MLQTQVNPQYTPPPDPNRLDTLSAEELAQRVALADAYVAREEHKMTLALEKDTADKETFAKAERDWDAAQLAWRSAQQAFSAGTKPMNTAGEYLASARRQRALLKAEESRRENQRRR